MSNSCEHSAVIIQRNSSVYLAQNFHLYIQPHMLPTHTHLYSFRMNIYNCTPPILSKHRGLFLSSFPFLFSLNQQAWVRVPCTDVLLLQNDIKQWLLLLNRVPHCRYKARRHERSSSLNSVARTCFSNQCIFGKSTPSCSVL